jgi:hypothetical protein
MIMEGHAFVAAFNLKLLKELLLFSRQAARGSTRRKQQHTLLQATGAGRRGRN